MIREYVKTCKTNKFDYIAIKGKTGVSIIDSISHCSSDKRICQNMQNQKFATLLLRAKLEYLSSIVFHTILVAREYVKTRKTNKCGYIAIKSKTVVSFIDSIPHCPSAKRICQNMQNQQIWLHCYEAQNWSFYHR